MKEKKPFEQSDNATFKHYIFCRHNLGLYSVNPYGIEDKEQWMTDRVPLLGRLLSSLSRQTNKNFTLILSIDTETPEHWIDVLQDFLEGFMIPVILCEGDPRTYIAQQVTHPDWLITSRIDNDDEYRPNFVETIQKAFRAKEEVIDVHGVQFDGLNYYTSGRKRSNSPFITLVEKWQEPVTVFHRPHSTMNTIFTGRFASNEKLYIQHIHDSNLMNKVVGDKIPCPWK